MFISLPEYSRSYTDVFLPFDVYFLLLFCIFPIFGPGKSQPRFTVYLESSGSLVMSYMLLKYEKSIHRLFKKALLIL